MINFDLKNVLLIIAIGIIGLLIGTIFGYFVGALIGTTVGFDRGVEAGVSYVNCLLEIAPDLEYQLTDEIIEECKELHGLESY